MKILYYLIFICSLSLNFQLYGQPLGGSYDQPSRSLPDWINSQIASGEKIIVIPAGRYYVAPQNRHHLMLNNVSDVEIIAHGVELICTQTTRAITIENCRNLTIRGLTIDYDPLPYTQGRITAISNDKRQHTIKLIDGYASADTIAKRKYEIYDQVTHELGAMTYHNVTINKIDQQTLQVTKGQNYAPQNAMEEVGDLIVIASDHAPDGWIPHAVYINNSADIVLEDVTLYASNMFGFFETNSLGSTYRRCIVDRRPLEDDLRDREYRRMRSLNADAFHSKHAEVGPTYDACKMSYMGDDGIAINGHYHMVTSVNGKQLRVIGKFGDQPNIQTGDTLELIKYTGVRLEDAVALSIQPAGQLTNAEKEFLKNQRMHRPMQTRMLNADRAYTIELDRKVDIDKGSLIASSNRLGNHFKIMNCEIGPSRSRGILVKSSHGEIVGNNITGCWGDSIKVSPEWWWLEAGSSQDILIEDNAITNGRSVAITVYSKGGSGGFAPAGAHRDMTIRNNTISDVPAPAIFVSSTVNYDVTGNDVSIDRSRKIYPWIVQSLGLNGVTEPIHITRSQP